MRLCATVRCLRRGREGSAMRVRTSSFKVGLMHKIGFVGCGNMGRAMLSGVLSAGLCESGDIIVSARTQNSLDAVHEEFGVSLALNICDAA